ncbi:hypothetical protein GCM10027360_29660 [Amycolatopsis echigonensis]
MTSRTGSTTPAATRCNRKIGTSEKAKAAVAITGTVALAFRVMRVTSISMLAVVTARHRGTP